MLPVVENTASPPENKFKSRTLDKPIAYHRPHKHVCLSKAHISQSTYPTTYNTNHDSPSHLVLFKLSDDTIISSLTIILLFSFYPRFLFLFLQIPSPLLLYKYLTRRALTQEKLERERESGARKILKPSFAILVLLRPSRSSPGILWQVRAPSPSHFCLLSRDFSVQFKVRFVCDVFVSSCF